MGIDKAFLKKVSQTFNIIQGELPGLGDEGFIGDDGYKLLNIENCSFKKPFDATINKGDYKIIMDSIDSYPGLNMKKQYARTVCDCCRAFVILGKHDYNIYHVITKLHQEA